MKMDPTAYASSRCDPLWQRVHPGHQLSGIRHPGRLQHSLTSRRYPVIERAASPKGSRPAAIYFSQEWMDQRQSDNVSFGEQRLLQVPAQTRSLTSVLRHAVQSVTVAGLMLTGVLMHLVKKVMADFQRALWWQERTATHRYMLKLAAEDERQRMQAELAQKRKIESESRRDAGDAQFLRMLHSMDDASIPLEAKWDAIAKQMSSKEEFRKQLSKLFELAGESSSAVQGLASSPAKFWKSAHTQSVIAQEEVLKRHLFTQMFDAGASPA